MLYARMIDGPRDGQAIPVRHATPIVTFPGGDRYRRTGRARPVQDGFEYEYEYDATASPVQLARKRLNMTQGTLARLVGCSRQQIWLIESGQVKNLGVHIAWRVAYYLQTPIEELFPDVARGVNVKDP